MTQAVRMLSPHRGQLPVCLPFSVQLRPALMLLLLLLQFQLLLVLCGGFLQLLVVPVLQQVDLLLLTLKLHTNLALHAEHVCDVVSS